MKNARYFPFERNKYFYGKLLSVADFECEQKYNNNKRRTINRLMYGAGIVCGLNVIKIDDSFISIESGFAFDNKGREMLLDKPVMQKLSMFEGYDSEKILYDRSHVYLCIEYDEKEKEPVHSVANGLNNSDDNIEYNKYREGCRIYLDYKEPEEEPGEYADLYSKTFKIYSDNDVIIKHILPKYVKNKESFQLKVIVEKLSLDTDILLDYEIELQCLGYRNTEKIKVRVDETKISKSNKYEINFEIKAKNVIDTEGICIIKPENFKLRVGTNELSLNTAKTNTIKIIENNPKERIIQANFENDMDYYTHSSADNKIYLARISLNRAGNTYSIGKVENNPFNQKIFNMSLLQAINNLEKQEINNLKQLIFNNQPDKNKSENTALQVKADTIVDVASGIEKIEVINKKKGEVVLSREITHGVGLGNVYVSLGIENETKREVVFGDSSIFHEDLVSMAVKVNKETGTMVIGLKILKEIRNHSFYIHWMVCRNAEERKKDIEEHITMKIKPDICDINILEDIYLEAVSEGLSDNRCMWEVKQEGGGKIDSNGRYTAPDVPGIYEVVAKSIENPEIKASTFIIVRGTKEWWKKI